MAEEILDDISRSIDHQSPSSSTPTSPTTQTDLDRLSTILPNLIRWRFYVFYAPFFSMLDLRPQGIDLCVLRNHPVMARTLRHASDQTSTPSNNNSPRRQRTPIDNPTDFAHLHASFLFLDLEPHLFHIDLTKFHRACCTTKRTATRTLTQLSRRLDIPPSQIRIALAMYADFVRVYRHQSPPSLRRAYVHLGARALADHKEWAALAAVVHRDSERVCGFGIYARGERERDWVPRDMTVIKNAVAACRVRYFLRLDVEGVGCGWAKRAGRGGTTKGNFREETADLMGTLRRLRLEDDEDEEESGGRAKFGRCWLGGRARSLMGRLGVRLPDALGGCRLEQRIVYRLSTKEELRMDGVAEMAEMIRRTPQPTTASTEPAVTGVKVKSSDSGARRATRVTAMETLDENDEERET